MDKAKQIVLEMLNDREYSISTRNEDNILAIKPDNTKMIVFFSVHSKLNINNIKEYIKIMGEMSVSHSLIVYQNSVTSSAQKIIFELFNIKIELFSQDELQYNITKHCYVPQHIKVQNKDKVISIYGKKFPIIFSKDPVSRYYDFQRGDLIKIIRKEGYICYRIVK